VVPRALALGGESWEEIGGGRRVSDALGGGGWRVAESIRLAVGSILVEREGREG